YANAQRFETSEHARYFGAENLLSSSFFERVSRYVSSLSRRLQIDTTVLVLRVEVEVDGKLQPRSAAARLLETASAGILRETDLVFDYGKGGWDYAIIRSGTDLRGAEIVASRLRAGLAPPEGTPEAGAAWKITVSHSVQLLAAGAPR